MSELLFFYYTSEDPGEATLVLFISRSKSSLLKSSIAVVLYLISEGLRAALQRPLARV